MLRVASPASNLFIYRSVNATQAMYTMQWGCNNRYHCVLAVESTVFVAHFLAYVTCIGLNGNHALGCKSVVSNSGSCGQ